MKKNSADIKEYIISFSTIGMLKLAVMAAILFLLWYLHEVLGLLFVALVLSSALDPLVDRMQRLHVPRGVTILTIYIFILVLLFLVVSLLIPPLISQLAGLETTLLTYAPTIDSYYQYITQNPNASIVISIRQEITQFTTSLTTLSSGLFSTVQSFVSTIASIIFVFVITFYITTDEDGLKKLIRSLAPVEYQPYLVQKTNRIQERLGAWLLGQVTLMAIIGTLTFIGLSILGVPYALVLALIAGLFEFIPYVGPAIAALPAIFFALTDSPVKAGAVLIFYIILQQAENQILVPKIMQRALGLSPIVILSAMLIGAKVASLVGVLLAVPAATILWIFFEDFIEQKMELDNQLEQ